MRRVLKWATAAIAAIIGIVAVLAFPVVVQGIRFESHRSEMKKLIESADAEDRELPQRVRNLLLFSLHEHTAPYATRLLIEAFAEELYKSQSTFNVAYVGWYFLAALHFSDQDRMTIIARLAPTGGNRHGLSNTSQALFKRPLSELSLAEAAMLIVLAANPPLDDMPDRLNAQRDQFLSRYKEWGTSLPLRMR